MTYLENQNKSTMWWWVGGIVLLLIVVFFVTRDSGEVNQKIEDQTEINNVSTTTYEYSTTTDVATSSVDVVE